MRIATKLLLLCIVALSLVSLVGCTTDEHTATLIRNAERSREGFTRLYGYCVACCIFMHLFINIGMTIGLMPVIGIPLPFISYGGSSLWGFTAMLFIFIALYRNEKKYF